MALIPTGYLKAVVSLGVSNEDGFAHHGTGFLYGHPISKEGNRTRYRSFLVTNKHVVDGGISHIRFNRVTDESLEIHPIASVATGNWAVHSGGADLALTEVVSVF